eukprot:5634499-Lingulodinium_polyedra.AAC.1
MPTAAGAADLPTAAHESDDSASDDSVPSRRTQRRHRGDVKAGSSPKGEAHKTAAGDPAQCQPHKRKPGDF